MPLETRFSSPDVHIELPESDMGREEKEELNPRDDKDDEATRNDDETTSFLLGAKGMEQQRRGRGQTHDVQKREFFPVLANGVYWLGVVVIAMVTITIALILLASTSPSSATDGVLQQQHHHHHPHRHKPRLNATTNPPPVLPFLWSHGYELSSKNRNTNIGVQYRCEGPLYAEFTVKLQRYATYLVNSGRRPATWGQRELPPNTRILIWGNSHTRQIGLSLMGQHNLREDIDKIVVYDANVNKNMARRFDLGQNRSVYIVANSYVAYSHEWYHLLEKQIKKKLWKMDALLVGTFNTCNAPVQTTFATEMKQLAGNVAGIDCDRIEGPNVTTIAQQFDKSLAYVSMFATYRHKDIDVAHQEMMALQRQQQQQQQSNETGDSRLLVYMDARQYVRGLGVECGSDTRDGVSDCINNATAARKYHRCTGKRGGHADLIAWDLTEFVWHVKELQQQQDVQASNDDD